MDSYRTEEGGSIAAKITPLHIRMGWRSVCRGKSRQSISSTEGFDQADFPGRMIGSRKERNLCTIISIALHLCVILLLMVPSMAVHEKQFNVVMVDFAQMKDDLKVYPGPNSETKKVVTRPGILKGRKAPEKIIEPARFDAGDSETVREAEQIVQPLGPTIFTASKSQNETVERTEAPISITSDRSTVPLQADNSSANARTGGDLLPSMSSAQDSGGLTGSMKGSGPGERQGGDPLASASSLQDSGGLTGGTKGGGQGGTQGEEGWAEGSENYNYIRDEIMKNIKYPDKARRLGIEGRVLLSFIVLENGTMSNINVINSSDYRLLDESAKEAVAGTRVTKKLPYRVIVRLPITYKLQGSRRNDRI